jgi:hypothetical protein
MHGNMLLLLLLSLALQGTRAYPMYDMRLPTQHCRSQST